MTQKLIICVLMLVSSMDDEFKFLESLFFMFTVFLSLNVKGSLTTQKPLFIMGCLNVIALRAAFTG